MCWTSFVTYLPAHLVVSFIGPPFGTGREPFVHDYK